MKLTTLLALLALTAISFLAVVAAAMHKADCAHALQTMQTINANAEAFASEADVVDALRPHNEFFLEHCIER